MNSANEIDFDHLRYGFLRFQTAFGISMFAVSVQFLLFLVPGVINRAWEGEMGGYFVIPAFFITCAIVTGGGLLWIFGFTLLRLLSRCIYILFAPGHVSYHSWDQVFCRSLWTLPWAFGTGALVYVIYFAGNFGGSPDDVIVGTIGNLLGAFCYGTIFYNWYRLCRSSDDSQT